MTTEILTFTCSICGEGSHDICVACTKDACRNHRCERCKRCSDCCGCDVPLSAAEVEIATTVNHPSPVPEPVPQPVPPPPPAPAPQFWKDPADAIPELFRPDPAPEPRALEAHVLGIALLEPPLESAPKPPREPDGPLSPSEAFPELFRPDPEPRTE